MHLYIQFKINLKIYMNLYIDKFNMIINILTIFNLTT